MVSSGKYVKAECSTLRQRCIILAMRVRRHDPIRFPLASETDGLLGRIPFPRRLISITELAVFRVRLRPRASNPLLHAPLRALAVERSGGAGLMNGALRSTGQALRKVERNHHALIATL